MPEAGANVADAQAMHRLCTAGPQAVRRVVHKILMNSER